jgi:hypothetical protein
MAAYKTAHLDDIDARDNPEAGHWRPVRAVLGVTAFGVNVFGAADPGVEAVEAHTETEGGADGHEELYFVARGHAEFEIDGEEVDAPAGTFVFVPDPATRRVAIAKSSDTEVLCIGAKPDAFSISPWERRHLP